jgi:hypothetical protein
VELRTGQMAEVTGEVLKHIDNHVPSPGSTACTVDLVLPTGPFLPDIAAWAQRSNLQQRNIIALTPMPNLWVEVCRLLFVLLS